MNDINDKRPFPLHEQSWYKTALQKTSATFDLGDGLTRIGTRYFQKVLTTIQYKTNVASRPT